LAQAGVIGSVAAFHYAFMGATEPSHMEAAAHALARLLMQDHLNAVSLVPVCPACTRAFRALARYLEGEGLPGSQISLIAERTPTIAPPRALWMPFELGRPLGAPGDTALQTRVLRAALALLEAPSGRVLVDFPDDAPTAADASTPPVCPVSFASPPEALRETDLLRAALQR